MTTANVYIFIFAMPYTGMDRSLFSQIMANKWHPWEQIIMCIVEPDVPFDLFFFGNDVLRNW